MSKWPEINPPPPTIILIKPFLELFIYLIICFNPLSPNFRHECHFQPQTRTATTSLLSAHYYDKLSFFFFFLSSSTEQFVLSNTSANVQGWQWTWLWQHTRSLTARLAYTYFCNLDCVSVCFSQQSTVNNCLYYVLCYTWNSILESLNAPLFQGSKSLLCESKPIIQFSKVPHSETAI